MNGVVRSRRPASVASGSPRIPESGGVSRPTSPVLLVEDRDSLRAVLRDTLKAEGYAVLEAADGEPVVEIA